MPPAEFAGDRSWGYNPAHIFAVESGYGGPDAFKAFVSAAHAHGIAVILDVVYNHFGPCDLDLWQFDGWSENDKGGIYFYNDWRADDAVGRHPARLRPRRGPPVHPRQRADVARGVPRRRAALGRDRLHPQRLRRRRRRPTTSPDGWSLMQWINGEIDAQRCPGRSPSPRTCRTTTGDHSTTGARAGRVRRAVGRAASCTRSARR